MRVPHYAWRINAVVRRVMTADNGSYLLEGPELAVPGTWTLRLDVLIDDFEKAIFETAIPIR